MIGQHNEKALLRRAEEVMIEKARTSEIFDVEAEQLLPRFKRSGECLFNCCHIARDRVVFILSCVFTIHLYNMHSNRT